jgi:membrane associated rhomboid family serine protease
VLLEAIKPRLLTIAIIIALIWVISTFTFVNPGLEFKLALIPRATDQWWGIFTNVFVHQDWFHLFSNTIPLIWFLLLLQGNGNREFFSALPLCLLLGALPLWLFGREGVHIGASGLVFALFGYLIANAFFARRVSDFIFAVAVVAGYWGLIGGLLPSDPTVSWDGHVSGVCGGIVSSWLVSACSNGSNNGVSNNGVSNQ